MNTLIIGNGFDLAHKLPTSYGNFLDFIIAYKNSAHDRRGDGPYGAFFYYNDGLPVWDEMGQLLSKNTLLIDYILIRYEELKKAGKNTWIDFEKELSVICQLLCRARKFGMEHNNNIHGMNKADKAIIQKLIPFDTLDTNGPVHLTQDFIEGRAEELHDSLNRLIRLLKIYLVEYVEKLPIQTRLPECLVGGFKRILSLTILTRILDYMIRQDLQSIAIYMVRSENTLKW